MYSYIKGIIADLYSDHIVIDNHGIGYEVHVSNPYNFKRVMMQQYIYINRSKKMILPYLALRKKKKKNCFKSLFL